MLNSQQLRLIIDLICQSSDNNKTRVLNKQAEKDNHQTMNHQEYQIRVNDHKINQIFKFIVQVKKEQQVNN